jgi:hypothetical protein
MFEAVQMKSLEAENKVAKKKLCENLVPFLKTYGEGQVVWKEFVSIKHWRDP